MHFVLIVNISEQYQSGLIPLEESVIKPPRLKHGILEAISGEKGAAPSKSPSIRHFVLPMDFGSDIPGGVGIPSYSLQIRHVTPVMDFGLHFDLNTLPRY